MWYEFFIKVVFSMLRNRKLYIKKTISLLLVMTIMILIIPVSVVGVNAATPGSQRGFELKNYLQMDPRWRYVKYNDSYMQDSACGILSIVNAVYNITGNFIYPTKVADWAYNKKYFNQGKKGGGICDNNVFYKCDDKFGAEYGFEVVGGGSGNAYSTKLLNHMKNGGTAVIYVVGHYMALVDYDSSTDKYLVFDCAPGKGTDYNSIKRRGLTSPKGDWMTKSQLNTGNIKIQAFFLFSSTNPVPPDDNVNLGDNFFATITNKQNGKPIENRDDNVVLGSNEPSEHHVWKFYRNDDGSYNIVNRYNWKALDLESYGNENGTNIKCYENSNNSAQRWLIKEREGGYAFFPECSQNGVMDLDDNNSETGTNIHFWTYNGTSAQIYSINKINDIRDYLSSDLGDDFYGVIFNKNRNKPIENRNGNVVLGAENHSENQVWHFIKNNDNTYNIVSLFDSKALDVSSYGNANGTNIKVYENSNNDAQRWYLNEAYGGYTISPKCSPNGVMDLDDNNPEDGTNIQFWEYNSTSAQIYTIEKLEDMHGYLSSDIGTDFYGYIKYSAAGLRLTNFDGNVTANTPEDMPNQLWKFERQSDNSYLIRSCLDGRCIDSENGEFEDGNNVQTYPDNGTCAQRWYFIKHGGNSNMYTIKSQLANSLIDVEDSSFESGTNVHLWHPNNTNAQMFEIEVCESAKVESIINSLTALDEKFYGIISSPDSGLVLANICNNVSIETLDNRVNRLWKFERQQDYSYIIVSMADGYCLDATKGKHSDGTNVQTYEDNSTLSQRWYLKKNGENQYIIKSGLGNAVLDIEASQGSIHGGENISLYTPDGSSSQYYTISVFENADDFLDTNIGTDFYAMITNVNSGYKLTNIDGNACLLSENNSLPKTNQIWKFERQSDNTYLIRNAINGMCLDSDRAKFEDGNNVQVYEDNGTNAQRWIIGSLGENQFLIKTVLGDAVLDSYTTGGTIDDGANLQLYHPNGTSAQVYEISKIPLYTITIQQQPDKTNYFIGQPLDTTGLLINLDYGDGLTATVADGFTVSGFDSETEGTKTLTITYQGKTTSFDVNVQKQSVSAILGDADGDGVITIMDATVIQRYLADFMVKNPETVEICGDVTGNGLDIVDATYIQRYLAEFTVPYNIGEPIA